MAKRRGMSKRRGSRKFKTIKRRSKYHQGRKRSRANKMRRGRKRMSRRVIRSGGGPSKNPKNISSLKSRKVSTPVVLPPDVQLKQLIELKKPTANIENNPNVTPDDRIAIAQNLIDQANVPIASRKLTLVDVCQDLEGPTTYGSITTFELLKDFSTGVASIGALLTTLANDDNTKSIIHGKYRGKALAAMGTNVKPAKIRDILQEFNISDSVTDRDKIELFTQWQTWVTNRFILATPEKWSTPEHIATISNNQGGVAFWLYKGPANDPKQVPMSIGDNDPNQDWHLLPI